MQPKLEIGLEERSVFWILAAGSRPGWEMVKCGSASLQFRVTRVRVRDKVRVGVRVSDGVRGSTFYFLSH